MILSYLFVLPRTTITMQTVDLNEKQESLGIGKGYAPQTDEYKELVNYANLKLATLGLPTVGDQSKNSALRHVHP